VNGRFVLALAAGMAVALMLVSHAISGRPADAATTARRTADREPIRTFTLQWVGDIAISSEGGLPPEGLQAALSPVASRLHDANLTIGNLEGTLSSGGASKCGAAPPSNCFAFQAPPSTAGDLRALGFGLVNQANNHSLDYGAAGRAQTIAALRQSGLPYTGLPGQITTLRLGGVRVAFVGFAPYRYTSNLLDIPGAVTLIKQARRLAQVVVVLIHAGAEGAAETHTPVGDETFLGEDRGQTRAFAHAAIDAGAAVVLGSGPHVVRGVEAYRGHLIAYSLGNFYGYHTLGLEGVLSESGILHVTLSSTGNVQAAHWTSLMLDNGLPRPDPANTSAKLVSALSAEDFPSDHFEIDPDGGFHP
jgi:Bacterial capsule synthesis protein PGA_cap